jgi:hypothetical protein
MLLKMLQNRIVIQHTCMHSLEDPDIKMIEHWREKSQHKSRKSKSKF